MKLHKKICLTLILSLGSLMHAHAGVLPAKCDPSGFPDITHSQTSLDPQRIITCDYLDDIGEPHPFITRNYTIVNNTLVPWTDYHFDLFVSDEEFVSRLLQWDSLNLDPNVGTYVKSGRQLSIYFNNPLGVGEQFLVTALRYGATSGGSTWVEGTPSIPAPGSLLLLTLGLLALRFGVGKGRERFAR